MTSKDDAAGSRPLRVVILGAGGHAQVIADALLAARCAGHLDAEPIGFLDDDETIHGQERLGYPVLGAIDRLAQIPHDAIIVGIGGNSTRQRLFDRCAAGGERLLTVIHPRATLAQAVLVGEGAVIMAGVVVNTGSRIGRNVILNTGCTVDHHNVVGDHAHIAPGVHLGGDVTIGEGTLVGIGATVMPQRSVGEWSIVAAGCLVHRTAGDHVTIAGVPGRVVARQN
jgi:sugar O-acyltransferase (sialic acid O-acetyltransferase NeuD family)